MKHKLNGIIVPWITHLLYTGDDHTLLAETEDCFISWS